MQTRQVERVLAVVERCLRKEFLDDFHKRCLYAALGAYTSLKRRRRGSRARRRGYGATGHVPLVTVCRTSRLAAVRRGIGKQAQRC